MPCPITGRKMFCAGPNFFSQPKNLTASSASSKTFVPTQKPILLNTNHLFVVWHKKCGVAQNILGPVKGKGIIVPENPYQDIWRFMNISMIEYDVTVSYLIKPY